MYGKADLDFMKYCISCAKLGCVSHSCIVNNCMQEMLFTGIDHGCCCIYIPRIQMSGRAIESICCMHAIQLEV